jgi:micrococcal nuclease
LEKEFMDKFVRVYQIRNNERALFNAMGHMQGYVVRASDGMFAQGALVRAGLAFAYPSSSHNDVILYDTEASAREAKVGFWADEAWQILTEDTVANIRDRFAIIEGTVEAVVSRNNIVYVNFGEDWKKDMTVSFPSSMRRQFSKLGIDVMNLNDQKIRARGWIRNYNGAFMSVLDPSQIEVIN